MELIVINKGVVQERATGTKFTFRQMLDSPIGLCYLYLIDKTPEIVEMEMRILNNGDRNAPVYYKKINKAFPIFWDDDMPEVPVTCMNIYELIAIGDFELIEVDADYQSINSYFYALFMKFKYGG